MVPRTSSRLLSPPSRTSSRAKSYLSISASVEADDEGSAFDPTDMIDIEEHGREEGYRPESYPGEDTRTTSSKELWGWYSYAFAAEVYSVCGLGSFIPITLEQLAREQGVLLSDHMTPCPSSSSRPSHPASSPNLVRSTEAIQDTGQCVVNILGLEMNTASFAMYTFSISVVFQTITIISMSGAADHGHYRKTMLLGFAFIGSVATMLLLPVVPSIYLMASLLAIIGNVGFGASFVLLNSFLPVLVRYHPENENGLDMARESSERHPLENDDGNINYQVSHTSHQSSTTTLLASPSNALDSPATSTALLLSTRISAYGIGIGYSAAVVFQILAIFLLLLVSHPTNSSTFPLRLIIFLIGIWWFLFTLPAALYLRPRPGPPLPSAHQTNIITYIRHAWRTLGRTILRATRLRDLTLFLAAWFLLSDALATVSGTAILFAKTELHMPLYALALINVVVTLSGVLGALGWQRVATALHLSPTRAIAACVLLFELIPLYGLLGAVPAVRRLGFLGLQQDWEMYVVGVVYGLVLGGLGSYCRALFAELVPPGNEAVFFALYAVTDKGSSIFGPAVVGMITGRCGSIRPAFAFLVLLIGTPLPLIWSLDVARGKREAELLAKELQQEGKAMDRNENEAAGSSEGMGLLAGNEGEERREAVREAHAGRGSATERRFDG